MRLDTEFLKNLECRGNDPLWRLHGVVVGHLAGLVRVKFDGEEAPRTIAACDLAKAGTPR